MLCTRRPAGRPGRTLLALSLAAFLNRRLACAARMNLWPVRTLIIPPATGPPAAFSGSASHLEVCRPSSSGFHRQHPSTPMAASPSAAATRRVVRYSRHGDSAVLEVDDLPVPPRPRGQVLIENKAAGVNPVDYKVL